MRNRQVAWAAVLVTVGATFAAGAAIPRLVELVCRKLEVKEEKSGETVITLDSSGDAKVGKDLFVDGKLKVGKVDLVARLAALETELAELKAVQGKGSLTLEVVPVMVRGGGNDTPNIVHPNCPEILANKDNGRYKVKEYRNANLKPIAAWWGPGSQPCQLSCLPNYTGASVHEGDVYLQVNDLNGPYWTYLNVYVLCVGK